MRMSNEETALVTMNPISASLEAAEKLGAWMAKSGMFGCTKIEQAQVLAVTCITEKITPLEFARTYDIIEGKPSMKSAAMLAKFVMAGGDYDILERTDTACKIKFTWRKHVTPFEFTIDEAKSAGLVRPNSVWTKYPKNMLFSRCVANYLRTYCPEHFAGHYTDEEVRGDVSMPAPPAPTEPTRPMFDNANGKTVEAEVVEPAVVEPEKPAPKKAKATAQEAADAPTQTPALVPLDELFTSLGCDPEDVVLFLHDTKQWFSDEEMSMPTVELFANLKPQKATSLRKQASAVVEHVAKWKAKGAK